MPRDQTNRRRLSISSTGEGSSKKQAIVNKSRKDNQLQSSKIRRYLLKFLLIFGTPIVFLLVLELSLRIFGYGYSTNFFEVYEDKYLIPNTNFANRFFPAGTVKTAWPFKIPIQKSNDTIRIFILGDSAAQGTPAPAFGFARILEVMLERQFPGRKFEVVNAAMRGINSHVVVPIAKECAKYGADAILVYLGNNEEVGLYAPEPDKFNIVKYPFLIELKHLASQTKISQLLESLMMKIGKPGNPPVQDFEYFKKHRIAFNDSLRIATIKNFESNLRKICRAGAKNGAKVFLSTIAVNLQDSPPFGSLHKNGLTKEQISEWENLKMKGESAESKGNFYEAIKYYESALKIDPEYAELNYQIAQCYKAAGNLDRAKEYYQRACDYDALPFRSESRINNVIRKVADEFKPKGVVLVDSEQTFLQDAINNYKELPGNKYFHEYVHFKFSGDYLLAKTFFSNIVETIDIKNAENFAKSPRDFPSQQECALRLGYTLWDELDIEAAMVKLTAKPLFQGQLNHSKRQAEAESSLQNKLKSLTDKDMERAVAIYEFALSERPDDWQIHFNYANLLSVIGNSEKAMKHYETVLTYMPTFTACKIILDNRRMELSRKNSLTPTLRANQGNKQKAVF